MSTFAPDASPTSEPRHTPSLEPPAPDLPPPVELELSKVSVIEQALAHAHCESDEAAGQGRRGGGVRSASPRGDKGLAAEGLRDHASAPVRPGRLQVQDPPA